MYIYNVFSIHKFEYNTIISFNKATKQLKFSNMRLSYTNLSIPTKEVRTR